MLINDTLLEALGDAYVYTLKEPKINFETFVDNFLSGNKLNHCEKKWIDIMYRRKRLEQIQNYAVAE